MRHRLVRPIWLGVALLVTGCGGSSNPNAPRTTPNKQIQAPGARVTFVYPRRGATVGPDLTPRVSVKNFKLAPYSSGTNVKQGEGQLHFSMDGGRFDQPRYSGANGALAASLRVNGKYSLAFAPAITYRNLPRGKHTLAVFLANRDRSSTGVSAETSFIVR
jgi:hypothetical protein